MLPSGSLRERVERQTAAANRAGALQPIGTKVDFVSDFGVEFMIRVATSLRRKDEATPRAKPASDLSPAQTSPFLNPDPHLLVADVFESHVCLLNKFPVVDGHLLIVTKQFERQENPLNLNDFAALWTGMRDFDSLGFYNSAREAGASQLHKHLQLVPLPLSLREEPIPIESVLRHVASKDPSSQCNALPFLHRVAFLRQLSDRVEETVGVLLETYQRLLDALGLDLEKPAPYNLLLTRRWMLLVPRTREYFESISLNALAFAGSLFVRTDEQLQMLKSRGPMSALSHVAFRQSESST